MSPLPGLPSTDRTLRNAAAGFVGSRTVLNPLLGCVSAIDGIVIKINKPCNVSNPSQYCNRKVYYALPVQAIVDHRCRFLYISMTCVGSTHDALAFSTTDLARRLAKCFLSRPFYLVGANAYVSED